MIPFIQKLANLYETNMPARSPFIAVNKMIIDGCGIPLMCHFVHCADGPPIWQP